MKSDASCILPKHPSKRHLRKEAVKELISQFNPKDRVLITIDPDPDSIGSAVALKRLLWHKVQCATVGIIRPMKRLNNITMARLLHLPLVVLNKDQLEPFDKYVLVDGQPAHNDFFARFPYTAIIDHHPHTDQVDAPFVDIRPEFGATASILTEYLRASKTKPAQSLATVLLYGIKTDTRNFERHTIVEDIEAFRYLFPLANHNVLRKIEISDLAFSDLKYFHKAVERKHVVRDRIFVHLDEVPTADILVLIAEFFLKVHDISWSVVSGIYQESLVIIVRNDGYRKDAGRSVRRAFGSIGCAGGHLGMARAELSMEKLMEILGTRSSKAIEQFIRKRLSPF
jgi:nanoRNase/pAp phosphatase (c-di-AMP/oligoRNAs hydrolase)